MSFIVISIFDDSCNLQFDKFPLIEIIFLSLIGSIPTVRHYLKALVLSNSANNIHRIFLLSEVKSGNSAVLNQMRDDMKFVKWKAARYPGSMFNQE